MNDNAPSKNESVRKNYVLIDYENVQPKNLSLLRGDAFVVKVFVGANQTKIPIDLAEALQALGANGQYLRISGSGRNALDFHIAFYLGELSREDPRGAFHVISKDTGFDPLIRHMREHDVEARRVRDLAEIPALRIPSTKPEKDQIDIIVKNLIGRGQGRPRKQKTLANTINSWFQKKLDEEELDALIATLKNRGYVRVKDGNVSYKLPKPRP